MHHCEQVRDLRMDPVLGLQTVAVWLIGMSWARVKRTSITLMPLSAIEATGRRRIQ